MKKVLVICLTGLVATVWACSKATDKPSEGNFDRKAFLESAADKHIIPSYTALSSSLDQLSAAVDAYVSAPDVGKMNTIKQAFNQSYTNWESCSVYELGPAEEQVLRMSLNIYPCDTSVIKNNIDKGSYDLKSSANNAARGFPALDYLLFGTGNTAAYFTDPVKGVKRIQYLKDVLQEIKAKIATVKQNWEGAYRNTFVSNTDKYSGSPISALFNQLTNETELVKNFKVGLPLGKKTLGTQYPAFCEGYFSQRSADLMLTDIVVLERVYTGDDASTSGIGFDDYLKSVNAADLNTTIIQQFATVKASLLALKEPLPDALVSDKANCEKLYADLQRLVVLLKTDMASALSLQITYQDGDGD